MTEEFRGFQDDEEYVYLDEDGMAHQKLEITVSWNSAQDKNLLVTLSKNDTVSYLESKIGETMEKFDLFQGLTDVRATNITNGRTLLPKKGSIGSVIKTGDHFTCDIVSKDQWLDVVMQLMEIRLCLLFEVKVINQARVSELLSMLVSIANLFLESNEIDCKYEVSDLKIEKRIAEQGKEVRLTRGGQLESLSSAAESQTALLSFHEDTKVEQCFSFLDRKIFCQMLKGREDVEKYRASESPLDTTLPFLAICESEGAEADMSKLHAFPIRYFRREAMQQQSSMLELQAEDQTSARSLSNRVCCCRVC